MHRRHVLLLMVVIAIGAAATLWLVREEDKLPVDATVVVPHPHVKDQSLFVAIAGPGSTTVVKAEDTLQFDEILEISNERTGERIYLVATGGVPMSESLSTREGDSIHVTLRNYQREKAGEGQHLDAATQLVPTLTEPSAAPSRAKD